MILDLINWILDFILVGVTLANHLNFFGVFSHLSKILVVSRVKIIYFEVCIYIHQRLSKVVVKSLSTRMLCRLRSSKLEKTIFLLLLFVDEQRLYI